MGAILQKPTDSDNPPFRIVAYKSAVATAMLLKDTLEEFPAEHAVYWARLSGEPNESVCARLGIDDAELARLRTSAIRRLRAVLPPDRSSVRAPLDMSNATPVTPEGAQHG
jgi:hypothetical protein